MLHDIANLSDPLIAAQVARHPSFKLADGTISRHALATRNAKILLKATYPQVSFKVTSNSYSGGSSLNVFWTKYPDAPSTEEIDELLKRFSYGEVDGMTDGFNYDRDPQRRAFRDVFGAVKYVMAQPHILTLEEQVAYEQAQLREAMGETSTPGAKAPRARL